MMNELNIYKGIQDLKTKNTVTGATITVWNNPGYKGSNPAQNCGLTINFTYAEKAKKLEPSEILANFGLKSENTIIDAANGTFSTIISPAYKSQIEKKLDMKIESGTHYTVEKPWNGRYIITFSKK